MIHIEVDNQHILRVLNDLSRHLDNLQPVMEDIGASLLSHIHGNLGRGLDYEGHAFTPLSEAYMERVPRRRGGIPLNDTRQHIYQKINYIASDQAVEVGLLSVDEHDLNIGAAHQYGVGVPGRPFLPIGINHQADLPHEWEQEILSILNDYFDQVV